MRDVSVRREHSVFEVVSNIIVPAILVALIPVMAIGYVLDHNAKVRQYDSNVASCQRGNLLRSRINDRDARNVGAFAEAAKILRMQGTTAAAADLVRAFERAAEKVVPIPLVPDCKRAFDDPRWPWQDEPLGKERR